MTSDTTVHRVALALGSNLGDRLEAIRLALSRLGALLELTAVSSVYESAPETGSAGGPYLNAVAIGEWRTTPEEAIAALLEIEQGMGRVRPHPGAPRTIDLDLILFDEARIDRPGVRVPHPRWTGRAFVALPLAEIAPGWRDPEDGRTAAQIAAALDASGVERYAPAPNPHPPETDS